MKSSAAKCGGEWEDWAASRFCAPLAARHPDNICNIESQIWCPEAGGRTGVLETVFTRSEDRLIEVGSREAVKAKAMKPMSALKVMFGFTIQGYHYLKQFK